MLATKQLEDGETSVSTTHREGIEGRRRKIWRSGTEQEIREYHTLGTQRPQFEQRMGLTWPRPCLLRPPFRRFTVIVAEFGTADHARLRCSRSSKTSTIDYKEGRGNSFATSSCQRVRFSRRKILGFVPNKATVRSVF